MGNLVCNTKKDTESREKESLILVHGEFNRVSQRCLAIKTVLINCSSGIIRDTNVTLLKSHSKGVVVVAHKSELSRFFLHPTLSLSFTSPPPPPPL